MPGHAAKRRRSERRRVEYQARVFGDGVSNDAADTCTVDGALSRDPAASSSTSTACSSASLWAAKPRPPTAPPPHALAQHIPKSAPQQLQHTAANLARFAYYRDNPLLRPPGMPPPGKGPVTSRLCPKATISFQEAANRVRAHQAAAKLLL